MTRCSKTFRFFILLGVCLLGGISAAANVDFTYQNSLLWGYMEDGVIQGRHLYCAMHHGLMILDIADPTSPTLVSKVPILDAEVIAMAVSGNYAYLGTTASELVIVDISDVLSPHIVGNFAVVNWVTDITVSGSTAYVCDEYIGLRVVDVSDPTHPTELGFFSTSVTGGREVVAVQDNYACVASRTYCWIVDVTDPADPQQAGLYIAPDRIQRLEMSGSTAYLAVEDSGLVTVDISDPAAPARLACLSINVQSTNAMDLEADHLFMATGYPSIEYAVKVVDISDPSQPIISGQIDAPAGRLNISQGLMFVTNGYSEFGLYDVSDLGSPQNLTLDPIPLYGYSGYGLEIVTDGRFIYIAGGEMGLVIVDNSDPTQPVVVSQGTTPNRSCDLELRDRYIYLVDNGNYATEGLEIVDVFDPTNPVVVGSLRINTCNKITLSGNYAFVGGNSATNYIVDISDPTQPVQLGTTYAVGITRGFAVKDNYLYISYGFGMVIADITDPDNPVVVDTLTADGSYGELLIYKGYLLAGVSTGFQVLDISTDPTSPTPIGFCACRPDDFKPYGDYLFVSNSQGVTLIDMFYLEFPAVVAAMPMDLDASSIAPYHNGLAVYDPFGLSIFQVSMPPCCAKAGDANYDLSTNLADVVYIINYIFKAGPPLLCPATGDVTGDCEVNISDAVILVNYIFRGGAAPTCSPCP